MSDVFRYQVEDVRDILFSDATVIYAKSTTEALKIFMKDKSIIGTVKRSASKTVRFKVTKTVERNGKFFKIGRVVWFEFSE